MTTYDPEWVELSLHKYSFKSGRHEVGQNLFEDISRFETRNSEFETQNFLSYDL